MKTAHVILAHPSAESFNHAWFRRSIEVLEGDDYRVAASDLFALGFDPAEKPDHYNALPETDNFDVLRVQSEAQAAGALPPDVEAEIAKVKAAELLIFHFPLWWFAPPAMIKGWCERVLVHGAFHTSGQRFEHGLAKGKRALFCVSCGVDENGGKPDGYEADTRMLLWPLAFSLFYCGFEVYEPVIQYGVHGFHEGAEKLELEQALADRLAHHDDVISTLDTRPLIRFNSREDFGPDGRLKPTAQTYSQFIRHD